ncbi:MAG: S41 family peptidase [Rubrobacteraceae bacterium]|nr:S41 family peptidase [Rubrobacter sp.]
MWNETKNKGRRNSPLARFVFIALFVAAVGGAGYAYGVSQSPASLSEADLESVEVYAEALDAVRGDYVDQESINPERQTYGAIEGMLDSLGDEGHTRFLTPEEREDNQAGLSGTYVGVGIQIEDREDRVVVSSPIEGSPAERAGVESGDVVIAVDGDDIAGEDVSEIADMVRGPEGSEVRVTVTRDGEEMTFDLLRSEINSPSVYWEMIPDSGTAHVRLASFSNDSAEELASVFAEARSAGAEEFILDLRDNPGGRLDQAVEMAGLFMEEDSVVYVRREADGERSEVETSGEPEFPDAPMTVLVNEGSASSSEILAGALRDNDRATMVGETTFGTGTVLSEFELSDGSSMLLGIAEWLTPDGDFIRETGIDPDIEVALGEDGELVAPTELDELSQSEAFDRDPQLERAFEEVAASPRD